MEKLKLFMDLLKDITLKLPHSFFVLDTALIVAFFSFLNKHILELSCRTILLFLLIISIAVLLILLFLNYMFVFGRRDKTNIMINLYGENIEVDKHVADIKEAIENELLNDSINDIKIIVPSYLRREVFSEKMIKKIKSGKSITNTFVFKFFRRLWNTDIIIFGKIKERNKNNTKIIINNNILITMSSFSKLGKNEKDFLTRISSQGDYNVVLNKNEEYSEIKSLSRFISNISKYYIGISYYIKGDLKEAYLKHKYIVENERNIAQYNMLGELILSETNFLTEKCTKNKNFTDGLKYIKFLEDHNIHVNDIIINKMSLLMYITKNEIDFKYTVIDCLKMSQKVDKNKSYKIDLSIAYLEMCRGKYKRAFSIYSSYFKKTNEKSIESYQDIIDYCTYAKDKEYEKNIAYLCMACINYYTNELEKAKEMYNLIDEKFKEIIKQQQN